MIPSWEQLRAGLAGFKFRSRFRISDVDRVYVARAGRKTLRLQAGSDIPSARSLLSRAGGL